MKYCTHKAQSLRRPRGLSLVELLVALVLSLFVVGAITGIYIVAKKNSVTANNISWLQENARFALHKIGYDVRMSGYIGELQEYWNLKETTNPARKISAVAGECFTASTTGTAFRWVAPMIFNDAASPVNFAPKIMASNNSNAPFADATHSCTTAGSSLSEYLAGTDILSTHYVGPDAVADTDLLKNQIYVRTDLQSHSGVAFQCQANGVGCIPPDAPAGPDSKNYPVAAILYYITGCGRPGDDGVCGTADDVPALMRVRLQADGTLLRERVADGVVDMQIQFGSDTDNDGLPNTYFNSNNGFRDPAQWAQWSTAKTVRAWLLMRTREPGYSDPNGSYSYGDANTAPVASYRYELFTTTLMLRNQFSPPPPL